jgi:hypothetical protein
MSGPPSTYLTNGQMRELARAFCAAIRSADCPEALPSDAWLDARLREHGCPEDHLTTLRAQIKAIPLTSLADGAS